jgi:hypothetical protein
MTTSIVVWYLNVTSKVLVPPKYGTHGLTQAKGAKEP